MKVIGIDPGISGGIAFIINDKLVNVIPMPIKSYIVGVGKNKKKKKLPDSNIIGKLVREFNPDISFIEKVTARPGQGVVSMFSFGKGTGLVIGAIEGNGFTLHEIRPQEWKEIILKDTEKDKQSAIDFCKFNFPNVSLKVTKRSRKDSDGLADAVCIGFAGIYNLINKKYD